MLFSVPFYGLDLKGFGSVIIGSSYPNPLT
jgi:hypothetical protein